MEWIKASERLPEKTGWYFVRKGSLKENAHKALHHMDVLKLAAGIEGYWSEVYEWLDESTPIPIQTPCVELEKEVERLKEWIRQVDKSLYIGEDLQEEDILKWYIDVVTIIKEEANQLLNL